MEKHPNHELPISFRLYRYGLILTAIGVGAIYLQIFFQLVFLLLHTVYDVVPADRFIDEGPMLLFILIPTIGIPSIILFVSLLRGNLKKNSRRLSFFTGFFFILATLAANAALLFGGGWFAGTILADFGLMILLTAGRKSKQNGEFPLLKTAEITVPTIFRKRQQQIALICCFGVVISGAIPFLVGYMAIPAPLIPEASGPASGIEPNHANTFFIMPIWEWQGTDYEYGIGQLNYMKNILGGDAYSGNGFVKIGRSVSCWYTNTLFENGSYDPTILIHTLNLSTISNTPVLFHMNGGNWGQAGSQHPEILAMRQNKSNCQWDQENVCHPIKYNPGPNDRFWSFWPNSDWERFRERNIKQALEVIYNWWQNNPDLLVGFSTDSEIHLNYNTFEKTNEGGYKSYFDYNPGTIQQYREWAQANWTLEDFNKRCGKNFDSWSKVDAPRNEDGVVGQKGNAWWETWTDFRVWHVKEAARRQCKWISDSGFPRAMIWNHQILSEPGDNSARYQRCDPLETAVNNYCKVGVTRYGWISPQIWHSLGDLALNDGSGDKIPSWGIFEWNLWTQHEYWAYREMLNCIYQYGGHVICPNEWANCSINEGLWIPGDPCEEGPVQVINGTEYGSDETGCIGTLGNCCCVKWDDKGNCLRCVDPHGNSQFLAALQDFVALAQDYERGTNPALRLNKFDVIVYDMFYSTYKFFNSGDGLFIMAGAWLICLIFVWTSPWHGRKRR
jgi:hypothetical protein